MKVYVCAPYEDALAVRDLHALLRRYGLEPTSTWATTATGPENLVVLPLEELRAIAAQNDADILAADVVLVRARPATGGEMFAECRLALELGKRIFWTGRRILSTYRAGVTLCEDVDDAIVAMLALTRLET